VTDRSCNSTPQAYAALAISGSPSSRARPNQKLTSTKKGDDIGDEGVGEAGEAGEEVAIGLGVESLRQLDIDDEQRHGESEHAIRQGLEPASRNETGVSFCRLCQASPPPGAPRNRPPSSGLTRAEVNPR